MLFDELQVALTLEPFKSSRFVRDFGPMFNLMPRFNLAEDAMMAVTHLSLQDPLALYKLLTFARMPYKAMWVEFADKPRKRAMAEMNVHIDPVGQPAKTGYLMISDGGAPLKGTAIVVWRHDDIQFAHPSTSAMSWDFESDVSLGAKRDDEVTLASLRKRISENPHSTGYRWRNDPEQLDAYIRLMRIFYTWRCPLYTEVYEKLEREDRLNGTNKVGQLEEAGEHDSYPELFTILATLIMFNAKNAFTQTPVALGKLNSAMAKKHKNKKKPPKPPLMDYVHVTMRFSAARERVYARQGIPEAARPLHTCRGHFKRRRRSNGTYDLIWWNEHMRGDATYGILKRSATIKA
jgi:hypothetical protein